MTKVTGQLQWDITLTPADENSELKMTVSVEDPQVGSSTLKKPLGGYASGAISGEKLGTGNLLHGKTFFCHTLVTDFDKTSDNMVLTISINGHKKSFPETAPNNTGSVLYRINIKLI
jgi:hypothetical protein